MRKIKSNQEIFIGGSKYPRNRIKIKMVNDYNIEYNGEKDLVHI